MCVWGGGGVVHMDQGEFRGLFQEMSRFGYRVNETHQGTKYTHLPTTDDNVFDNTVEDDTVFHTTGSSAIITPNRLSTNIILQAIN